MAGGATALCLVHHHVPGTTSHGMWPVVGPQLGRLRLRTVCSRLSISHVSGTVLDSEDTVAGQKAPSLLSQRLQSVGAMDSCQIIIQITLSNCGRYL